MSLPTLPPLLWLIFSGLFFAGGEYLSKRFVMAPQWPILIVLLLLYCLGALCWIPALMQQKSLSVTGTMWSVISLCMTVFIGIVLFDERLNAVQSMGIVFAIAAIVMLSLG